MATRMMGRTQMRDVVIHDLVKEQNELQRVMIDVLSAVKETHPELLIKYSDFIARIKKGN